LRLAVPFALAAFVAGCSALQGQPPVTYDLTAPREVPNLARSTNAQILVPETTALRALDSERIMVTTGSQVTYYPDVQWPDRLPKVIQTKIIQTFEASKRARAVGRPGEGLSIDYQLFTEARAFKFDSGVRVARVEIYGKLLNDRNGRVLSAKLFSADVPVQGSSATAVVGALDTALSQVLVEMVQWTLGNLAR
jgi:cholesterol transport system auxiliary component